MNMDRREEAFALSPGQESITRGGDHDDSLIRKKAIVLHRLGWSLVPLARETKVALVGWKHLQVKPATLNQLGRWMVNDFPGCNYGVITGTVSGIIAVEADDSDAVSLLHDRLPMTPLRQRSRKGEHWVYRHPGLAVGNRVRCSVGGKEYALDIRGDGGLIVGPGSTHASGHVYTEIEPWTAEALARTPVFDPSWIDPRPAGRGRRDAAPTHLPGREPNELAVPHDIRLRKARYWLQAGWHDEPVPGTRQGRNASGRCFWIACKLVQGFALTPDEALPLFAEWGQGEDQLDEYGDWYPWSEGDLYHKLADADRHEDREGRARGYMLGFVQPPADKARLKDFVFASRL